VSSAKPPAILIRGCDIKNFGRDKKDFGGLTFFIGIFL